jgi:hypothetical protein
MKVHPLILALATVILTVSTASAQDARFNVGAGWMLPTGDYWNKPNVYHESQSAGAAWQLMGAVEVTIPRAPVGLRVDGMYGKIRRHGSFDVNGSTKLNGGTADLVYRIGAPMVPVRLYLLAGLGYYSVDLGLGSESNVGYNAGTGLSIGAGPTKVFVEGRYISVQTSGSAMNFFPVTAGLSFGL